MDTEEIKLKQFRELLAKREIQKPIECFLIIKNGFWEEGDLFRRKTIATLQPARVQQRYK